MKLAVQTSTPSTRGLCADAGIAVRPPVALATFDLLVLRGQDIRDWPIEKRKMALQKLLEGVTVGRLYVSAVDDGEWLYQHVRTLGMEGIVAKRAGSLYRGGASDGWRKIKVPGYHRLGKFQREPIA
ncbi:hypothetical protein D8I24_2133 [Cupriavidus necator H850]|nr:hypothetical protein [Cupriavidus necator]KAI3606290.1 hypothetical protein D8I24_2133 [Cupriavidus necator H850]